MGKEDEMMSRQDLAKAAEAVATIRKLTADPSRRTSPRLATLQNVVEDLDAGGKFLKCIVCDGATAQVLDFWGCNLLVWGSYFSREYDGTPCVQLAAKKLTDAIKSVSSVATSEGPESDLARQVLGFLTAVAAKMSAYLSMFPGAGRPSGEFDPSEAFPSAGFLVPLSCGHNGSLSREERRYVNYLLKRAGVLGSS